MNVVFIPRYSKASWCIALWVGKEKLASKEWIAVWEASFDIKRGSYKNTKKVSNANIRYIGLLFWAVMYSADRNWLHLVGTMLFRVLMSCSKLFFCVNVDINLERRINQRCLYCSVWIIHLMKLHQLSAALEVCQQCIMLRRNPWLNLSPCVFISFFVRLTFYMLVSRSWLHSYVFFGTKLKNSRNYALGNFECNVTKFTHLSCCLYRGWYPGSVGQSSSLSLIPQSGNAHRF